MMKLNIVKGDRVKHPSMVRQLIFDVKGGNIVESCEIDNTARLHSAVNGIIWCGITTKYLLLQKIVSMFHAEIHYRSLIRENIYAIDGLVYGLTIPFSVPRCFSRREELKDLYLQLPVIACPGSRY